MKYPRTESQLARSTARFTDTPAPASKLPPAALRSKKKFLRFFPGGFADETYYDWERGYKFTAHQQWQEQLSREQLAALIRSKDFAEIAARAVRIESRTNLLFSFEKMALRDALRDPQGARAFAIGLFEFLYGESQLSERFANWIEVVAALPRKQTRVLTWPLVTVFGFIAQPKTHLFLKPNVTRIAAREYGHDFAYKSKPSFETYAALLRFAAQVKKDLRDLKPKDMIDIQSFLWVQGSDEYEE